MRLVSLTSQLWVNLIGQSIIVSEQLAFSLLLSVPIFIVGRLPASPILAESQCFLSEFYYCLPATVMLF